MQATGGRKTIEIMALLGALLLTAACGGSDGSDAADPETTTTEAPAASTTTTTAPIVGFEATAIAAGDQHACALDPDGAAWCWGYNRMGQLGDGTNEDSNVPVAVSGDLEFTALSAGRYFTCGLTPDGATWCWGENSAGELGDGTTGEGGDTQNRNEPVEVLGDLAFEELATGQLHVCGRTAEGEVWCWGAYASGQLGNDAGTDQVQPGRSAPDLQLDSLEAAGTNTCGLDADGAAWCWGSNNAGQLGNGATSNARQPAPSQVGRDTTFTSLTIGRQHTCGLDADGAAWCWGENSYGQLGDGSTDDRTAPTAVLGDHTFAALTGGTQHTCGLTDDGEAWCWGANVLGQLGDDAGTDAEDRTSPVAVAGGITFRALSAGEDYTCGIADDGVAWCWGSPLALGNGVKEATTEPVPVAVP